MKNSGSYKDINTEGSFNDYFKNIKNRSEKICLHKKCSDCKGTGLKSNGQRCIHFISCNCDLCSLKCIF